MKHLAALLATSAVALLLATTALAQSYDAPNEEVIVRAPPQTSQRSNIGASVQDVSMSREVRFDDLDLRTVWGAETLRSRIRNTALTICQQLENQYVTLDDNRPCYRAAYDDAMVQADNAIRNTRIAAAR